MLLYVIIIFRNIMNENESFRRGEMNYSNDEEILRRLTVQRFE